ncbi:hypothetical protein X956_04360 [Trueperella pyogenes TP8]|nr:hypothetical protein X956_04360 [Trueperella pyogenes TP8]
MVAGDSGGAPEAVLNGKTGLVVNGRSIEAITAALDYLLENPERAAAMGEAGRRWVDEQWRWSDVAKPLIEVLS